MKGGSWTTKASQIGATTFVLIATPFLVIILFTLIAASRVNEQLSFFWENVEPVINLLTLLGYMVSLILYVWKSHAIDESTSLQLIRTQNEILDIIRKLHRDVVGDSKPEPRNVIVNLRNKGYPRISELLQAAINNIEAGRPWECIARLRLAIEVTYEQALRILDFKVGLTPHFGTMRKAEVMLVNRGDLTPIFIENARFFRTVANRTIHSAEEPDVNTARNLIDVAIVLVEELLHAAEKAARAKNTPSS